MYSYKIVGYCEKASLHRDTTAVRDNIKERESERAQLLVVRGFDVLSKYFHYNTSNDKTLNKIEMTIEGYVNATYNEEGKISCFVGDNSNCNVSVNTYVNKEFPFDYLNVEFKGDCISVEFQCYDITFHVDIVGTIQEIKNFC